MARSSAAKFFCESCGAEVPRNARFCKKCGRFFASVRCPSCGTTGSPDRFRKGCPECGYAPGGQSGTAVNGHAQRGAKKGLLSAVRRKRGAARSDDALPAWVYVVSVLALLVIFGFGLLYFAR